MTNFPESSRSQTSDGQGRNALEHGHAASPPAAQAGPAHRHGGCTCAPGCGLALSGSRRFVGPDSAERFVWLALLQMFATARNPWDTSAR